MSRSKTQVITQTVRLHPQQAAFRSSQALYRGFVGGRGAGKTWVGAYDLLRRCQSGHTYLAVSPTYVLLDDITLPTFTEIATELGVYRGIRATPHPRVRIQVKPYPAPYAIVRFRSADRPDSLRGPNLSGAWLDEASLMEKAAYDVAIGSLREKGKQGWLSATFTPKGRSHWTYNVFGPGRKTNVELFHCHTRDNPFLPPEFAANLAEQYSGLHARQELGGEFVSLEGCEWPAEYFTDDDLWFSNWPTGLIARASACDPSKGRDAKKGDYAAFVDLGMTDDGTLWVDCEMVRGESAESVAQTACEHQRSFRPDGFGVETNQFLQLFAVLFDLIARRSSLLMPIVELNNQVPKLVRIRRLGPYLHQRRFRFRDTPGCRLLVQQLQEFPEGEHDDGPDSLEMSIRVLSSILEGVQDDESETVLRL